MSNVVSMAIPSGFLVCIGTKDERILSSNAVSYTHLTLPTILLV